MTATMKRTGANRRRGKPGARGLEPTAIVDAAIRLREAGDGAEPSLRAIAAAVGCDPMAVLYHFGSKQGLERAIADAINARLQPPAADASWRDRLRHLAAEYRRLALEHPRCMPLLMNHWVTGPADYAHAEHVYRALAEAGLEGQAVVDTAFGWYAATLGLAIAEAGGLLRAAGAEQLSEIDALPDSGFAATRALRGHFPTLSPARAAARTIDALLDAVEAAGRSPASAGDTAGPIAPRGEAQPQRKARKRQPDP